jgi:gluconate 5-dehydrogenase
MNNELKTPIDLGGTRVLITGGTSGLGLAMATALVEAGATVALTSRSLERAQAAAASLSHAAIGIAMDSSDESSVHSGVKQVWSQLGGIDLLVNNAGLGMITVNSHFMTDPQGFWKVPTDKFRAVIETNLTGYFLVAKEVVLRMLEAGSGNIVNISVSQSTMIRRGGVPYGPSRAGSEALSRVMAADLQDSPIRVNTLLPGGPTETGMLSAELPAGLKPIKATIMGPPIVWLASPQAHDVHDERIIATEFDDWLARREE